MKTNKTPLDLEQLLTEIEHAGRNARRQEQLAEMIDQLATTEQSKKQRSFWWWTVRVAAAACVFFFISTAIRIWFLPTKSELPLVAHVEQPTATPVTVDTTAANVPTAVPTILRQQRIIKPLTPATMQPEASETPVLSPEYLAEEIPTPEPEEEAEETTTPLLEENNTPIIEVATTIEQPKPATESVAIAAPAKKERHNFLSLFRRTEPSKMEGTTLALLQF